MPVVEFKNLTKAYAAPGFFSSKKSIGIEDLCLQVEQGEVFGLLGLNGAGKTTSIRTLLGLIKPTKGSVTVFGREAAYDQHVRSELGYLPESVAFPEVLTAAEILIFFARLDREKFPDLARAKKRINEVLEITGLGPYKSKRIAAFSKGMRQRLGIAQAILHKPKVLVLDEPASGLDPLGIIEMRELFVTLNRELAMTVLFSSHSIGEVEKISDRVAIIAKNRLVKLLKRQDWQGKKSLEEWFLESIRL
ncbi:MAG: ABC transporter ATP-binding protein [Elusimicrobiota bacterium]